MNTEQELRPSPCPFCGGKAKTVRYHAHSVVVRCTSCECEGPDVSATETEAIAAWNRRSSDEQAEVVGVPAATIIAMRDALIAGELNEAYHQLYTVADPEFCQMEPWRNLEHKAALASPPAVAAGGVTVTREMAEDARDLLRLYARTPAWANLANRFEAALNALPTPPSRGEGV